MARVDWTVKPCPTCGTHLELHLEKISPRAGTTASTSKVVRLLKCPKCEFMREDEPAPV